MSSTNTGRVEAQAEVEMLTLIYAFILQCHEGKAVVTVGDEDPEEERSSTR